MKSTAGHGWRRWKTMETFKLKHSAVQEGF